MSGSAGRTKEKTTLEVMSGNLAAQVVRPRSVTVRVQDAWISAERKMDPGES